MPTLESIDLGQTLEFFSRTRARVAEATAALSDAQWRFKPAPDRWSIAEILEHMVIVEERVLGPVREQLAQAPPPAADRDPELVDAIIFERLPDRSVRAKAPVIIEPTGQLAPALALERLSRNYEKLREYVTSTPDLREHVLESPPIRYLTNGAHTDADGYQWALTVVAHDERHIRQMLEVKAAPGFPA